MEKASVLFTGATAGVAAVLLLRMSKGKQQQQQQKTKLPGLTLTYFDFAGKAEPIRLLLYYLGVPFTDHRFADRSELATLQESGILRFGQVPALRFGDGAGVVLNQTAAIMRFVGRRYGGADEAIPEDDVHAALVDALMDQEADMLAGVRVCRYKDRFGFMSDILEEILPRVEPLVNDLVGSKHLALLEKIASESSSGWIAGTAKPSIADFFWVPQFQWIVQQVLHDTSGVLPPCFPALRNLVEQFWALPQLSAFAAERLYAAAA